MGKAKKLWLLLSLMLVCCDSYKVFVMFPMPDRNRAVLGDELVKILLNAGHEVTYLTPFPHKDPPANLRVINITDNVYHFPQIDNILDAIDKRIKSESHGSMIALTAKLMKITTENKNVMEILKNPNENFDVVIAEWMFTDLPSGYAAIFGCPYIMMTPIEIHWLVLSMIDDPSCPAYTVDSYLSQYLPPLTFFQRLNELWNQVKVEFIKFLYLDDFQGNYFDTVMAPIAKSRGRELPYFNDARFNISLVLANSYVSLDHAISVPQAYKLVGGYHIEEDVGPLPKYLQKIMDESTEGVIYFSMGLTLTSKVFPDQVTNSLLKMFGTLNQTVLWKLEDNMLEVPPNVHIVKQARQHSILAHPNCTLFITHGDLLAVTEAVHFSVPVVGIPVYGDQFMNIVKAEKKGFGKLVYLSYDFIDELKEAIIKVTSEPRYSQKVKELSFIHHDRPAKPRAEVLHWVEHVIRTSGARHLRSPALDLPYYQKMYFDLFFVINIFLITIMIPHFYYAHNSNRLAEEQRKND